MWMFGSVQQTVSVARKSFKKVPCRRHGQAAFEFALILPVFIVFMLLIVDFGVLTYQYVSLANAAREGARYGATGCGANLCNQADVWDRTRDRSGGILDAGDTAEVSIGWANINGDSTASMTTADAIVVSVVHPYNFLFVPGARIDVISCADMRVEHRRPPGDLSVVTGCAP